MTQIEPSTEEKSEQERPEDGFDVQSQEEDELTFLERLIL